MKTRTLRNAISIALFTVVTGTAGLAVAQEATTGTTRSVDRDFDLPTGELAAALDALRTQSDLQIGYQDAQVAGKRAKAVRGRMHWRDALDELLQGSGLEYRQIDDSTIVIQNAKKDAASADGPAGARSETTTPRAAATDLEAITVTGTRIRGGTSPSPVITIGSENIREEGFTDLGEVIRSMPQNFSGGQNPGVLMGNVTGAMVNQNATGGSSLNLRGLGPDASLTLLNGRRMSYGGFVQAVDISAIPVEAVERLEIVADGASAIYGSDAVGGVGNVIIKRDFEGFGLGTRYGTATNGGMTAHEYNATAGTSWATGGVIATYKSVSSDPIYARQRHYTAYLPSPSTIYPGSDLRSGLLSVHQAIGRIAELQLDALRTEREQLYYFFSTDTIYNQLENETATSYVSPRVEFFLPGSWTISAGGAWGKDDLISDHSRVALGTGLVSPLIEECFCNTSRSYDVSVEGPLFPMGGGDMRVAMGAGRRTNEFLWHNRITDMSTAEGREGSRFIYAETHFPLFGSGSNIVGVRRLEVTAAVRSEDYDSFGRVTTPKLGLVYDPSAQITVKLSWGKSFKAPTLLERYRPMVGVAIHPSAFGGAGYADDAILLFLNGGNPDLKPERARTWMTSVAFHPEAVPGLEAELSWFDIDYTDRVVQPLTGSGYFTDPANAEYLDLAPTAERQEQLLAAVDRFSNLTGGEYDSERVVAILDGRYINTVWQKVRGMDLAGSYRFHIGGGQMTVRGAVSWLDSSRQTAGMANPLDLAGTLNYPAKVNGRMGALWVSGGFSASAFANYTGRVTNPSDGDSGASFTVFDATLRYSVGQHGNVWSGVEFALAGTNLFDRAPPQYASVPFVAPYDSTNYSAIGRNLNFSVAKRW